MNETPKIGLVIGTYDAVPYVHLHLEALRHWGSKIPVLVHDDGSPKQKELGALCETYGASLGGNPTRLYWRAGDYSSILHGLKWAQRQGLDLLVKMSRRFIPLYDWVPDLQALCTTCPAATYSACCADFGFQIRSECMALNVPQWMPITDSMQKDIDNHSIENDCPEIHIFRLACRVSQAGFVKWERMLGRGRRTRQPETLWHDIDGPVDYCRAANVLGLGYTPEDFVAVD